jgi:hypothetical protein
MRPGYTSATCRWAVLFAALAFTTLAHALPTVSLSPTSLSFGNQTVGTSSKAQVITVTNTGSSILTFSGLKLTGSQKSNYSQTNTCGATLGAGATCTVSVTFSPTAIGSLTATLQVSDNAANSPQTASLSGTGVGAAATLSPASLSFNGVTVGKNSSAKVITVTNSGTSSLSVTSVVASGDFTQTNNCTSIAAGSSCTINVTFTPSAAWSRSGNIVISDNAYLAPTQVVLLVGMGNSGATASVSTKSLAWGTVNLGTSGSMQPLTLTNTGTAVLNINSIIASGDFSQTNTCPSSLAVNARCTINVTFTPSNTGPRTGDLTVNDTDPAFLQTVALTGTGADASSAITITPRRGVVTPFQTQQFTAAINGVQSSNVTWSVDGITGGNTTVGTISTSGLYTPPLSATGTHIIEVTNKSITSETAVAFLAASNYAGTYTFKNDSLRTGQNLNEVALTTGNVNQFQFGKVYSYPVSGYTFAQPLYVEGVNIPHVGIRNVVYVATEGDMLYAFDADNTGGTGATPLWQVNFTNSAEGITTVPATDVETGTDIPIQIGITATPVIDPSAGTIFVVVRTKEVVSGVTSYVHRLHALSITTGEEKSGSPVEITASVDGTGAGSVGGKLTFDGLRENPRAGLLLEGGTVYIAWSALEDIPPYHGWLIGYNETTLAQEVVLNLTPNGSDGGIWLGGIMADSTGNVYTVSGNGTFDASVGGKDYGESVVKLSGTGSDLSITDYFAPYNQEVLSGEDWDLGAGGATLLPDQAGTYPHVMLAAGKGGTVYELNRDSLGGYDTTADQNLLTVPFVVGSDTVSSGNRAAGPAYWQTQVFMAGSNTYPMQFSLQGSLISTIPIAQSNKHYGYPGGSPVISANGNTNGIVWILQTDKYASSGNAILRAFDASNISRELYDSSQDSSRDKPDAAVKFTAPTVANGKVFVPTQTKLDVFGLLP